jgi:DNA helicase II / ATP-dependent DNA helicase PcrA
MSEQSKQKEEKIEASPVNQKPEIKQEETAHLKEVLNKITGAKSVLQDSLKIIGESNLQRLTDLRTDEGGADFEMFLDQLNEKNETFNFKDKFQRLEEFEFLLKEPYFARIDLVDPQTKSSQKVYIGKFGYTEHAPVVTDWRTKVASVYYRYRYPQKNVSYDTPAGKETRDLTLKRTFEIDNGELTKYYNNDIQFDENEIIIDKISKRTGGVLEDIVETIQISQLDIIEADPRQVCIVQGTVGSGKSTVAIHKLAHIFFNYPTMIHPERSVLVAKNQILVGYLSTLFPKLGIFDIYFKTLRELVFHLVFREELGLNVDFDIDEDTSRFRLPDLKKLQTKLNRIHKTYEKKISNLFNFENFRAFSGYKYSVDTTPYENIVDMISDLQEELDMQKEKLKENPNSVRAWLFKENIKTLRNLIRELNDLKNVLKHKILTNLAKQYKINTSKKLGYFDTLVYLYMYSELIGISKFPKFEYCVVDEGQDFSILEYLVLSKIVLRGRFAIFGDLNQSLEADGITTWNDITKVIKEARTASTFELDTNYRSTKPIIDLANKILSPYTKKYLPKSINRKGTDPEIKLFSTTDAMMKEFEMNFDHDLKDLDKSIGIICFNDNIFDETDKLLTTKTIQKDKLLKLNRKIGIKYVPKGVYYMKAEDCKGLEFAKVYVLGLNLSKIANDAKARQAFVSVTRAMNDLMIYGLK